MFLKNYLIACIFLTITSTASVCDAASSPAGQTSDDKNISPLPVIYTGISEDHIEPDQLKDIKDTENMYDLDHSNVYTLELIFTTDPGAEKLDKTTVKILDKKNHIIEENIAYGPIFLISLDPGEYKVMGKGAHISYTQNIIVKEHAFNKYHIHLAAKK